MFSLLLAAISTKNKGIISSYKISFRGDVPGVFINAKELDALLVRATGGKLVGFPVVSVNLHQAEKIMEENSWIDEAELYFDSGNNLHVTVSEKRPVARVFTLNSHSFFIDRLGRTIPVSPKSTAKLPAFTGFPYTKT